MHRVAELLRRRLAGVGGEELVIFIDRLGDDVEIEPLGLARRLVHVQRQAFRAGVGQPFLDGQAVALRLGDLLALLVEEQFVIEALRRPRAEHAGDLRRQGDRVDQVLAGHLVVDLQRHPAHRPVGLPLQLAVAAGHRHGHPLAVVGVDVADGASLDVAIDGRHLQHDAGLRADRQERRIGCPPLGAERWQDDALHRVIVGEHRPQCRVEAAGLVAVGGRQELVLEAEGVEEGAQPGIVVLAETGVSAERVGHLGQRLAQMLGHHLLVGDIVRHLAQAVHVVGEAEQPGRQVGEQAEGLTDHGGAGDLAEGADVRQARRAIAGLEQHIAFGRRRVLETLHQLAGFLEHPGLVVGRGGLEITHLLSRRVVNICGDGH